MMDIMLGCLTKGHLYGIDVGLEDQTTHDHLIQDVIGLAADAAGDDCH